MLTLYDPLVLLVAVGKSTDLPAPLVSHRLAVEMLFRRFSRPQSRRNGSHQWNKVH
ncbi:hypothetical protein M0208_05155 [Sphingomonas sp. SUN019]|uniref:hypothetical protein n=1 Tax=Sphingomonas sp. SUN019 TaxID=2937788 RepID=UPI002164EB2A|nr:hypothetical protein [Sphingomonas sp. SUN019]UVO49936.1 hypothetical protein M0208_05155 [Sphingomonas sp. SUN019]